MEQIRKTSPASLRRKMRMKLLIAGGVLLALATSLMLFAFQDSIVFFQGPTDIVTGKVAPHKNFRLGGLVEDGTVQRSEDGSKVMFFVTDGANRVGVEFKGILPDLFREGQGVVVLGKLNEENLFLASEVLAKHDENYMPAEVVEAMKNAGTWQGDTAMEQKTYEAGKE